MRFAAGPLAVAITASDEALARAAAANFLRPPAAPDAAPLDVVCRRLADGRIQVTSRGGDMTVENDAELTAVMHALVQDGVGREWHTRAVFHAAACVAPDGRALLIAGESGAGKSTAALALALRGWRCLTDDLAFVDLETLEAGGCDPAIRLDAPAPAALGALPAGWTTERQELPALEPAGASHVSHLYRPPTASEAQAASVPVGGIVFPGRGGGAPVPLSAGEALDRLWPQRIELAHTSGVSDPAALGRAIAALPMAELFAPSVEAVGPGLASWWETTACGGRR
jgi:hypothetical protein